MNFIKEIVIQLSQKNPTINHEIVSLAFQYIQKHCQDLEKKEEQCYEISQKAYEFYTILSELTMDTESIVTGILLELYEKKGIHPIDIQQSFGSNVLKILTNVSALNHLPAFSNKEPEKIRKMMIAMAKDVRVVIIKLIKRLLKMRSLKYVPNINNVIMARETLDVFTPIAHRLGLGKIKWELEDLSFYHLEPIKYKQIVGMIQSKRRQREEYIERVKKIMNHQLKKCNFNYEIQGRAKHLYSIYKKIYEKGKSFDKIYDLIAFRIIVEKQQQCYDALSLLHSLWQPIEGRFKDYITKPRTNGYQSIHTSLIGPEENILEVQIRTQEMHRIAEEGVAAHWKYKENLQADNQENIYSYLKNMLSWHNQNENSKINQVVRDLFDKEVFIFTPAGDVFEMPVGSTPLDLAFRIHTQIGFRCTGARVNGKIIPLHSSLSNGDTVELITSSNAHGPGRNWLQIVKTGKAKTKIRKWFKDKQYEEKIKEGKIIFEKELIKNSLDTKSVESTKAIRNYLRKNAYRKIDDFYFRLCVTRPNITGLISRIKLEQKGEPKIHLGIKTPTKNITSENHILVEGLSEVKIHIAKCCFPKPGQEIIGFITLLQGVSIHSPQCKNFLHSQKKEPNRVVAARWQT